MMRRNFRLAVPTWPGSRVPLVMTLHNAHCLTTLYLLLCPAFYDGPAQCPLPYHTDFNYVSGFL